MSSWVSPRALAVVLVGVFAALEALSGQLRVSDRLVIAVAGDVLPEAYWQTPSATDHFLDGVQEEFSTADLVLVNLEAPITRAETVTTNKSADAVAAGRDYILRASNPAIPKIMRAAGVGLVGLANNHMMDYSDTGLRDTLGVLAEAQLPAVGAGFKAEAEQAFVFEKGGRRVAFLAFSDVVPPNYQATATQMGVASSKDEGDLVRAIQRARQQAEFVVLMVHWGSQGKHLITLRQRQVAELAAQAGCDAVVGMHPHVLQGIEFMGRVPIFYSLGNFAFPSRNPTALESLLVKLSFDSKGIAGIKFVPVQISPSGAPRIARAAAGKEILAHLDGYCRMFNTRVWGARLAHAEVREPLVYDRAPDGPKLEGTRVSEPTRPGGYP